MHRMLNVDTGQPLLEHCDHLIHLIILNLEKDLS